MSTVSATIDIDRRPEEVWKTIMDPTCYSQWVSIHRKICDVDDGAVQEGFQVERCAARRSPCTGR